MKSQNFYKVVERNTEGFKVSDIKEIIPAIEAAIMETLKENKDETIRFGDLGTFKVKHIKEKNGMTHLNGIETPWHKDARDELVFVVSKKCKDI